MRATLTLAAVSLLIVAGISHAVGQPQTGTGANGGMCFGPNCGPGAPPNVGTGATGGLCFGPNCGPASNTNRSFSNEPIRQFAPIGTSGPRGSNSFYGPRD